MLSNICCDWNLLYTQHPAVLCRGAVTIEENENIKKRDSNQTITITCPNVVMFPTKDLDQFDFFGSLTNKNCDGALLYKNEDDTFDLVYLEMKSRFSLKKVFEAKCQIIESRVKMKALLEMVAAFNQITIKSIIGVIITMALDDDQKNWWSKRQLLPDDELEFGDRLLKCKRIEAPTNCNTVLDFPNYMTFQIAFSNDGNSTIDYRNLAG